jgi:CubicO group peptidase (beta-lactamase class C family)
MDLKRSRRRFLATAAFTLVTPGLRTLCGARETEDSPLASFDREVEEFMKARGIPGGSLAVVRNRRLIYARGYGWADREGGVSVGPETLFRIASVSKPLTAVAVLHLAEQGRLSLEDRVFGESGRIRLGQRAELRDPRLKEITVRQLLQHTAGWDRARSGDPMFRWKTISKELGLAGPPEASGIIRYMLRQPLDTDPGKAYAYSNFGYCVLGRVIEQAAGSSYDRQLKQSVLGPMGIRRMRIGEALRSIEGETRYYTVKDSKAESVFPEVPGRVPTPYGSFSMQVMDAHGGWLASAVDLARFAAALDDPARCPVLSEQSIQTMYAPPPPPPWRNKGGVLQDAYYGCGWMVRPVGREGKANYWHAGSLPGTSSLLVRRWDGLSWAVLFNQRSENKKLPDDAIDGALHRAAAAAPRWPEEDLFGRFD